MNADNAVSTRDNAIDYEVFMQSKTIRKGGLPSEKSDVVFGIRPEITQFTTRFSCLCESKP